MRYARDVEGEDVGGYVRVGESWGEIREERERERCEESRGWEAPSRSFPLGIMPAFFFTKEWFLLLSLPLLLPS